MSVITKAVRTTLVQNLWDDALAIASSLNRLGVAFDLTFAEADLPHLRAKTNHGSRVLVEVWPTSEGDSWHIHGVGVPIQVLPVASNPRDVANSISRLINNITA